MPINFESKSAASRCAKLQTLNVLWIRAEFDFGFRGKDRAHYHGIKPAQYNKIGRRQAWSDKELLKGRVPRRRTLWD